MRFRIPDWAVYFLIVFLIYTNARQSRPNLEGSIPPPDLGPLMPAESPRDTAVLIEMDAPSSGIGTTFAIDNKGSWLTARHVVDGCDEVGINLGSGKVIKASHTVSRESDISVLKTDWKRTALATDMTSQRRIGEHGYFFGFPQGKPGEAVARLLGRHRLLVRGRYRTEEAILAWTELGRTRGLRGSLGGMSGGPVLDSDGEVIGVVAAESPRRGRIYSVAPSSIGPLLSRKAGGKADPITDTSYGMNADRLRRERRIAQVICVVN